MFVLATLLKVTLCVLTFRYTHVDLPKKAIVVSLEMFSMSNQVGPVEREMETPPFYTDAFWVKERVVEFRSGSIDIDCLCKCVLKLQLTKQLYTQAWHQ